MTGSIEVAAQDALEWEMKTVTDSEVQIAGANHALYAGKSGKAKRSRVV